MATRAERLWALVGSQQRRWLAAIVVVSVLLRAGAALYMGDRVQDLPGLYDQITYDHLARNLLEGDGLTFDRDWWPDTPAGEPTAHWSYATILYLAGVYRLAGHHPLVARLIQAVVVGVLMPVLTYRLGRRTFGPAVGVAAAAISAGYIYFIYYATALMTEAFLLVAVLWTFDLADTLRRRDESRRCVRTPTRFEPRYLLLGLAIGLGGLLRQTFLVAAPLVYAWLWWATPGRRLSTRRGLLLASLVLVLVVSPWTIRNYLVFDEFVLLNTNAGYALFWGTHPVHGFDFTGEIPAGRTYGDFVPAELESLNEAAKEKALRAVAVQHVAAEPGRYLLLCASRLADQFWFWPSPQSSLLSNVSRVGSFGLFLPFMLYGKLLALRGVGESGPIHGLKTPVALWLIFIFVYNGAYVAVWGSPRYRLPTDALMIVFAGLALTRPSKLPTRRARV